jgi:hypothetical protein
MRRAEPGLLTLLQSSVGRSSSTTSCLLPRIGVCSITSFRLSRVVRLRGPSAEVALPVHLCENHEQRKHAELDRNADWAS